MKIESKKDLRLVGRAINERWEIDREKVVSALHEVIERRDPDMMLDAAALLIKADDLNRKREEQEAKEVERRLRLLELLKQLPVGELARRAEQAGIDIGQGKGTTISSTVNGKKKGKRS